MVKSSYIKDILTREFKGKIGFHSRPQKILSELVYDTSAGGSYVEAALSSIGVSSEQLVCNVAEQLRDDIKSVKRIPWGHRRLRNWRRRKNSCHSVKGKAHVPNTYMKLSDSFPSTTAFKTLLCNDSNKRRL